MGNPEFFVLFFQRVSQGQQNVLFINYIEIWLEKVN
jgi:hypothetical protein